MLTAKPSRQIPDLLSRIFQLTKILEFFTLTIKKRKCIEMKSLPYIVIVYMLAQSSCTPKLLKEYAGSPRIFYEKDTTELKLDIDSVKQYSRVLSFLGSRTMKNIVFSLIMKSVAKTLIRADFME